MQKYVAHGWHRWNQGRILRLEIRKIQSLVLPVANYVILGKSLYLWETKAPHLQTRSRNISLVVVAHEVIYLRAGA